MRQKKVNLIVALLFLIGLTGLQAQNKLYVRHNTGTQASYVLSSIRKITFASGNMDVVKTDGNSDYYDLKYIQFLSFRDIKTDIIPVGFDDGNITLYPNPVIDNLHISFESINAVNVQIEITDLQGRVLYQQTINSQYGINQAIIPVDKLSEGLYLCRLQNGNKLETIKFLKN